MIVRAFAALMLGPELGRVVRARCEDVLAGASGVRLAAASDQHATVFFLGAVAEESLSAIEGELAAAAGRSQPLELVLGRAGAFPAPGRERVLWLALEGPGSAALQALALDVRARMARLGFPTDDEPWRAHLTVARVKRERARPRERPVSVPRRFYELDPRLEWKPRTLSLVESSAGPSAASSKGSRYRARSEFALGG